VALALRKLQLHYRVMIDEPQAAIYKPDPAIESLADWLGASVEAADFPETNVRFRNNRAAANIGFDALSDEEWARHFGRFRPLEGNLEEPLALKYHGHQFRNYNPDIGDGRGFLFAQMRGRDGRLMDLGTKGTGTTPFSRAGDGRLTLKGGVREILATEMLEALGVNTSKTLSIIETGEKLWRDDEPSPTRSAVMVRLSHSHIRIGTFQRLLAHEEADQMEALTQYCLEHFPGPPLPEDAPDKDNPAVILMHNVVERLADLAASYMVAGFVHGVLNTDNMNITGESCDYGPWRWLPQWEPGFTAAYFDHSGLYAFGRQPEALHWNCGQLAVALRLMADSKPLIAALERFGPLYMEAIARRWCWRLGVEQRGDVEDAQMVGLCEKTMRESKAQPDRFFFDLRKSLNGQNDETSNHLKGELGDALSRFTTLDSTHEYWQGDEPQSMVIEEVEAIWSAIEQADDWSDLQNKVTALRQMGEAHGAPPTAKGHIPSPTY